MQKSAKYIRSPCIHIIIIRTCSDSSLTITWYWMMSLHCGCGREGRFGSKVAASKYNQDY